MVTCKALRKCPPHRSYTPPTKGNATYPWGKKRAARRQLAKNAGGVIVGDADGSEKRAEKAHEIGARMTLRSSRRSNGMTPLRRAGWIEINVGRINFTSIYVIDLSVTEQLEQSPGFESRLGKDRG